MRGRQRNLAAVGLVILNLIVLTGRVTAHEMGDFGQTLAGGAIGSPAAVAPPEGVYYGDIFLYAPFASGYGQYAGLHADGVLNSSGLVWSTGWDFLGAKVVMGVSQSLFDISIWNAQGVTTYYPTVHNTRFAPFSLSWNLGSGWFASSGFALYAPDGTRTPNTVNPDYWTYEANGALTYLRDGWNLSAYLAYDINTPSAGLTGSFAGTPFASYGIGYRSGDQMFLDLTATKKFDKWEIGPVASFTWQTTADQPGGGVSCGAMAAATGSLLTCGRATDYALGGLVGYDFGRANLKLYVTDSVYTKDDFAALKTWAKLAFPLWVPQAPGR